MYKDLSGAVLAGGQGRRMQKGSEQTEKGLLLLEGLPLVGWVSRTLLQRCSAPLLISANQHADRYAQFGTVVPDPYYIESYQGPLAGLLALLEHCTTSWLMVLPVDTPFVSVAVVEGLWAAKEKKPESGIYFVQHQRSYPLCLLIHKKWLIPLREAVQGGQRRVQSWLMQNNADAVDFLYLPAAQFFNINTPEDIKSAQQMGAYM